MIYCPECGKQTQINETNVKQILCLFIETLNSHEQKIFQFIYSFTDIGVSVKNIVNQLNLGYTNILYQIENINRKMTFYHYDVGYIIYKQELYYYIPILNKSITNPYEFILSKLTTEKQKDLLLLFKNKIEVDIEILKMAIDTNSLKTIAVIIKEINMIAKTHNINIRLNKKLLKYIILQ